MNAAQLNLQIIAGEGGRRFDVRMVIATESKDTEGAAELRMARGGGFFFCEAAEFAGATLDGGAGYVVRKMGSFGAGAFRKRENMEIGEGAAFDEGERCGVIVFGFSGETGDDVGTDGCVGEAFVDKFDAASVMLGAIPAVHGGED